MASSDSSDSLHYFLKGYRSSDKEPPRKGLPDSMDVLWVFAELDTNSLPLSEISSLLMISKQDTIGLVSQLRKRNLVSLIKGSQDIDLGNIVELTARGRSLVKQIKT